MSSKLLELLSKANALFSRKYPNAKADSYNFTLGKMPRGWRFSVINSWQTWHEKHLETDFGLYAEPEHAVEAFLSYVKENNIDVVSLMHE